MHTRLEKASLEILECYLIQRKLCGCFSILVSCDKRRIVCSDFPQFKLADFDCTLNLALSQI